MTNKQPFQDPEIDKNASTIKLDNSKSRFASKNVEKNISAEELHGKISEFREHEKEIAKEIMEQSRNFMGFIKNKVVRENKSPIEDDLEKETIRKLIQLSMELNNDDTQPEGIGSLGLCNLLFRAVVAQRDIINNLEYKYFQLERQLSSKDKTK